MTNGISDTTVLIKVSKICAETTKGKKNMKQMIDYRKPELREYSRFGIVAEGASPAPSGEDRANVNRCNTAGLDEEA